MSSEEKPENYCLKHDRLEEAPMIRCWIENEDYSEHGYVDVCEKAISEYKEKGFKVIRRTLKSKNFTIG